jgi:integrase
MSRAHVALASFFEEVYRPSLLRDRGPAIESHFRTAVGWLAKVLGRTPMLADLNRLTLEAALAQMAKAGLSSLTLRNMRKRWLQLWRYAAVLGWREPAVTPPLPRPVPVFRPWTANEPPAGSLLKFYRGVFRPELRPQVSAKELARYDCAINHFHDFVGKLISLEEVTPDLLDDFAAWSERLAVMPVQRQQMRGCLRRIMRAAEPERFPKRDGRDPQSAVGPLEQQERALGRHGSRGTRRLPEPIGEPGTLLHFFLTTYRREAIPHCSVQHDRGLISAFRRLHQCFGRELRLEELGRETIVEMERWLTEGGAEPVTVKNILTRLQAVWRYAHCLDLAPAVPAMRRRRMTRDAPDAWSLEELAGIIDCSRRIERAPIRGIAANQYWPAILLVCYYTALRRGSLVKIRMEDLDLKRGTLFVPGTQIKNGHGKIFHLGADAIEAIQAIWEPERELLFPPPAELKTLGDHFRAIIAAAGVPKSRRSNGLFHKLRRTVITQTAVRAGMAAAISLAGHSSDYCLKFYIDPSYLPDHNATTWLPSMTDVCRRQNLAD